MRSIVRKVAKGAKVAREPGFRRALARGVAASVEHDAVPLDRGVATVLDIGANRGQFALYASVRFPEASILSFEPIPEAREKLLDVVPRDRVKLFDVALSDSAGQVEFHVAGDDDSSSMLPASELQRAEFPGSRTSRDIVVETARLDDVVPPSELNRPLLMKLDVQGAELQVLRGAELTLERTDYVLVECSFVELYEGQASGEEIIEFLTRRGFLLRGMYSPTVVDGRILQADALLERDSAATGVRSQATA